MTRQSNHLDLRELALRPGAEAERVFDLEIAPVWLGGVAFSAAAPVWAADVGTGLAVSAIVGSATTVDVGTVVTFEADWQADNSRKTKIHPTRAVLRMNGSFIP